MKSKSRKVLSTLMALAMVFGLFAAMPLTASAANDNYAIVGSAEISRQRDSTAIIYII
jgi:Sec-independent protein secretion pathway component TatC